MNRSLYGSPFYPPIAALSGPSLTILQSLSFCIAFKILSYTVPDLWALAVVSCFFRRVSSFSGFMKDCISRIFSNYLTCFWAYSFSCTFRRAFYYYWLTSMSRFGTFPKAIYVCLAASNICFDLIFRFVSSSSLTLLLTHVAVSVLPSLTSRFISNGYKCFAFLGILIYCLVDSGKSRFSPFPLIGLVDFPFLSSSLLDLIPLNYSISCGLS